MCLTVDYEKTKALKAARGGWRIGYKVLDRQRIGASIHYVSPYQWMIYPKAGREVFAFGSAPLLNLQGNQTIEGGALHFFESLKRARCHIGGNRIVRRVRYRIADVVAVGKTGDIAARKVTVLPGYYRRKINGEVVFVGRRKAKR